MGKVRKRKVRHNAPVNNSDEEELPVESKESAIQTIIDQLQVRCYFLLTKKKIKVELYIIYYL